jgi:hypothetical protein
MGRFVDEDFSKLVDFIHDCVELGNDDDECYGSSNGCLTPER